MDSTVIINVMENINPLSAPAANTFKCPPNSTPLHAVSPERMNQQRIPQSPSLHSALIENDRPRSRDSMMSDVQSKVAFLNSLSTPSSPTKSARLDKKLGPALASTVINGVGSGGAHTDVPGGTNSAFQRAVMGYEEAQASLATLNAELERAKEEIASRKKRERMVASRLEMLMEELQAEKDKRTRDQESYAKEVKRCRKETYRAELGLVESREELKDVRNELKKLQAELVHEKTEKEKSRQEAFERAYALAGVLEEMEQVKDRLRVAEKEKEAAIEEAVLAASEKSVVDVQRQVTKDAETVQDQKSSAWLGGFDGHVISQQAVPSAETKLHIPVPSSTPLLKGFEAIKLRLDIHDKKMEGEEVSLDEEIEYLKMELQWAKRQQRESEDLVHFMHMQCQFKACPCRVAEESGERFVHDHAYEAGLQPQHAAKKRKMSTEVYDSLSLGGINHIRIEQSKQQKVNEQSPIQEQDLAILPESNTCLPTPITEDSMELEEALAVPLPDPHPTEISLLDHTPEPTAQLEEITQVMVEPGTSSQPFSFSTSTMSNATIKASGNSAPKDTTACADAFDNDLFDMSPPKQMLPRRPSTAMGILTMESPIRLVPDSPRSYYTDNQQDSRATPPTAQQHQMFSESTTTTKIALKGTPARPHTHRRAQSRPNLRSHSPLTTSSMVPGDSSVKYSADARATSASPAATTVFPITPLHKYSRSTNDPSKYAQDPNLHPPQTVATMTTTTRVPLRGATDADDVFSPVQDNYEHAHTEIIRMSSNAGSHGANSITGAVSSNESNKASILGNVPGTPISREAALAQIRARRDRARSVNLKGSVGSVGLTTASGPHKSPTKPRVVNGAAGLFAREKDGAGSRREISQASAPGRFAY